MRYSEAAPAMPTFIYQRMDGPGDDGTPEHNMVTAGSLLITARR